MLACNKIRTRVRKNKLVEVVRRASKVQNTTAQRHSVPGKHRLEISDDLLQTLWTKNR